MTPKEYIESGILELYVYGLLSETENEEVAVMATNHKEINDEIIAIEKAIVNLSSSFSPFLSADNFEKIKTQLELKHKVIDLKQNRSTFQYIGWAAALVLLFGIGYQYTQLNQNLSQIVSVKMKIQNYKKH